MKLLIYIDKLFNAYYKAKKQYINFISLQIYYIDWQMKGTIKSTYINGERIIYNEPISYKELKRILTDKT
jgi:hypothetical protein